MELEIQDDLLSEYCDVRPVDASTSAVARAVDAVYALPVDPDNEDEEQEDRSCPWCRESPCVWASDKNASAARDESKCRDLVGNE
jgi:hypothetical protein